MMHVHVSSANHSNDPHAARPRRRPPHGMAIMLVMLCIVAVTIMAAAYAASRENTPQLSSNIASGSTARTAAMTGLQMARAVFECENADFRSSLVNGVLLSNVPVGDGTVTVVVTALDGSAVTQDTQYFDVKATGSCDGMEQVAEAHARVALDDRAPTPTFSDFALFGADQVEINAATLTRWSQSPNAKWGAPLWIGTNSIGSGHINLAGAANILDTCAQVDSDGGSAVVCNTTDTAVRVPIKSLAGCASLPVLASPTPNTSMCSLSPTPNVNITSGTILSDDSWILYSARIAGTGVVRVNAGSLVTRHVTGNVTIEDGGQLIVETDHDFVIDGNLTVRNGSSIQVNDGVRCRIWVGGTVSIDDAAVGISLAQAATVASVNRGLETYKNPNECQLYQKPGASSNWTITDGAIVVARIYAPAGVVRIDHASCVMGSVLGSEARLVAGSALHYDPCLDNRGGYTNTEGPLYNGDGSLNTVLIASITDISDSSLASLKSLLGGLLGPVPFLFPWDPSPRNRLVEWAVLRTGIEPVKDNPDTAAPDSDSGVLPAG